MKAEFGNQQFFDLFTSHNLPYRLRLTLDTQAGCMVPLRNSRSFVNDRFFTYGTLGYRHLGHSQSAFDSFARHREQEETESKANQYILGDDPGAHKYCLLNGTLMLSDLPYIKEINNARVFAAAEMLYYPSFSKKKQSFREFGQPFYK